jgi:hypothetical protein
LPFCPLPGAAPPHCGCSCEASRRRSALVWVEWLSTSSQDPISWLALLFWLEARGDTQAEAWRLAVEQAKALGMAGRRRGG